jgi:hypothetical protein
VEYLDAEEEEFSMISMTIEDLLQARYRAHDAENPLAKHELPAELREDFDPSMRIKSKSYSHTYTHCEIHPSMILGVCATIVPFPDHNQVSLVLSQAPVSTHVDGLVFSHPEIPISLQWGSKPWVSLPRISKCEWTQWRTSCSILKSRLRQVLVWST